MPEDDFPGPTPGPDLAALRVSLGISQKDLAQRLGMHRVSVRGWEKAAEVPVVDAARYRRALREIVNEATADVAV